MLHNPPEAYSRITPYLLYEDVEAAIGFLERAFGFEERLRLVGEDGRVSHAELAFEGEILMLGSPGGGFASPRTSGVDSPVFVHLYVDDVDAVHARARAAGAEIVRELAEQFYGDRTFAARDPERLSWFFAQHVRDVSEEELAAAMSGAASG